MKNAKLINLFHVSITWVGASWTCGLTFFMDSYWLVFSAVLIHLSITIYAMRLFFTVLDEIYAGITITKKEHDTEGEF